MAACYFDVDGTLVRTNLVHPTVYYLLNQANPQRTLGKVVGALLRAPRLLAAELQDRRLFNEELYALYKGTSEDRLLTLADDAYEKVLKPAIFKDARKLVATCKDKGHEVVIISGALDFLMARLAKELGADDVIANKLEFLDGLATGRMLPPVVAGPTKALLVRDHARDHGHDLDECFAYSDSYSDVPMLSVVGHPAAVNPDRALDRLARSYQWPVVYLDRP
ncbi:MAG: HAD family phosphatase [Polyangiales bacterium]